MQLRSTEVLSLCLQGATPRCVVGCCVREVWLTVSTCPMSMPHTFVAHWLSMRWCRPLEICKLSLCSGTCNYALTAVQRVSSALRFSWLSSCCAVLAVKPCIDMVSLLNCMRKKQFNQKEVEIPTLSIFIGILHNRIFTFAVRWCNDSCSYDPCLGSNCNDSCSYDPCLGSNATLPLPKPVLLAAPLPLFLRGLRAA